MEPMSAMDRAQLISLRNHFRNLRTQSPELWLRLIRAQGDTSLVEFIDALEGQQWQVLRRVS